MQELIPLSSQIINGETVYTINARDLHGFLGVGKDFSCWIKERIKHYGFVEDQDFVCDSAPPGKSINGIGRKRKEYYLTHDAALLLVAKENGPARDQLLKILLEKAGEADELWRAVMNFEIPESIPAPMYVYAIKNQLTGNIKIGISKNPEARLKQLQVGNDGRLQLKLIAYRVAHNRYADEKLAHKKNKDILIRGEWFGPSATIS